MQSKKVAGYQIDLNHKLGNGTFGDVYLSQEIHTGRIVAIKQITTKSQKSKELERNLQLVQNEIQIMKQIKHPNIVQLIDVQRTPNNLYLILEFCNQGNLEMFIRKKCGQATQKYLLEDEAKFILRQIISGYKALYRSKVMHRDLKLQNILMHDGVIKICDFGFSKVLEVGMEDQAIVTYAGSPLYMAPQILSNQKYSSKADVWSMGVIAYEVLFGSTPWQAVSLEDLLMRIRTQPLKFPIKPQVSQPLKQLVTSMLQIEESNRISWEDIFQDPYFDEQKEYDLAIRMKQDLEQVSRDPYDKQHAQNKLYFTQSKIAQNLAHANQMQLKLGQICPNLVEIKEQSPISNRSGSSRVGIFEERQRSLSPKTLQQKFKQQVEDLKQRQLYQNITDWIIHRKNKSVQLNNISQLWFDLYGLVLKNYMDITIYYAFLFVMSKYQSLILNRMLTRLESKCLGKCNKFNQQQWEAFIEQKDYRTSLQTIKNDARVIDGFFQELIPRVKKYLSQNQQNLLYNLILNIAHNGNVERAYFNDIYQQAIKTTLQIVKQAIQQSGQKCDRQLLVLGSHLYNMQFISEIFKFKGAKQIDYFQYETNICQESNEQILQKLNIKQ